MTNDELIAWLQDEVRILRNELVRIAQRKVVNPGQSAAEALEAHGDRVRAADQLARESPKTG